MKYSFFSIGLLSLLAVSCSYNEITLPEDGIPNHSFGEVFYATIDEQPDADTKVYADDQLRVLWNADDRITIFNKYTYGYEYYFKGEDGDTAGAFGKVPNDDFVSGNTLDLVYAVYPHSNETKIDNDGIITLTLPAEQTYKDSSFGIGANTMVSKTTDNQLRFKNVGGYLSLKFFGEGVSISSITLKGNNGEFLAGKCSIDMSSGLPVLTMDEGNASETVTLTCDPAVDLGNSSSEAIAFWFVLPPVTLTEGFTVTVTTPEGAVFEKSSSNKYEIGRSSITRMGAMQVTPSYTGNINFVDPKTKQMCVANWDTNGDGELSYEEAAAVTDIGDYFTGTDITSFDEFKFFTGVSSIWGSFKNCSSLTSIDIPNSVISIEVATFKGCSSLSRINLPEGLTSMGSVVFSGCYSLKAISLPSTLTQLDHTSLTDNGIEKVECYLPLLDGYFVDGKIYPSYLCRAFMNDYDNLDERANIKEIVIKKSSDTATYDLPPYALAGFSGANDISFPDGMVSIGNNALVFCKSLAHFDIQETVTSIGINAFQLCTSLNEIVIPEGVTTLEGGTFSYCTGLTGSIIIPNGITSIGESLFYGCIGLESIVIPESVTSIEYGAFHGCSNLINVNIPDDVTTIGPDAFKDCSSITEIRIPDGVTVIRYGMFKGCTSLTSITIPERITSIEDNAFEGCSELNGINIPQMVTSIGKSAFAFCSNLKSIVIPESVTSVGDYAFNGCSSLVSVNIPDGVTSIGNSTFKNCSSLISICIPEGITSIMSSAFLGCSGLTSIVIPETVTKLGGSTFCGCTGLTSIYVKPSTPPSAGVELFKDSDCPIYVPYSSDHSILKAYQKATYWSEYKNRMQEESTIPDPVLPEVIDLGSGVGEWASFNIGANSPEEVGSPFAWGEVETKSEFGWDTYKWFKDDGICKYYNYAYTGSIPWTGEGERGDDLIVLEDADDAAATIWGSEWRMPTKLEIDNLLENCDWVWTQLNNVWGYQVKSRTNDNSIFLPAIGTESTSYWTSSYYFDNMPPVQDNAARAYCLVIRDGYMNQSHNARYLGFYIRPIHR